jgi:hypothetical protein
MKGSAKACKIIAIVLNAIFLAGLLFGMSRYGVHPRTLLDKAGCIFILVFPAVTLVTIALTFRKEGKMPACVMKVIAVIVNVLFLIILISAIAIEGVSLEHFGQLLVCIMGLGLPVVNLGVLALAK